MEGRPAADLLRDQKPMPKTTLAGRRSLCDIKWAINLDGMVRKPILDLARNRAYVIVYRERSRSYLLGAYALDTGEQSWETEVANGGYGTPGQSDDLVVLPYQFNGIVALRKSDGVRVWEHHGVGRVRSSVVFHDGLFYYSSGGEIFGLDAQGRARYRAQDPAAFFFGEPLIAESNLYSLGVAADGSRSSIRAIYCFDKQGLPVRKDDIGEAGVVSSDVSGLLLVDDSLIVGGPGYVTAITMGTGAIKWRTRIQGDAARHACSHAGGLVFFTTLDGIVGALHVDDGAQKWQRSYRESLVTPVTPVESDGLVFAADGYLCHLSSEDGRLISKRPIGHCPYSALVLAPGHALLGAGEPPYDGILVSLAERQERPHAEISFQAQNAILGVPEVDFVLTVPDVILADSLKVRVAAVSIEKEVVPLQVEGEKAFFRFPLDSQCAPGDYALLVTFKYTSGSDGSDIVLLTLARPVALPNKVLLNSIQPIPQEERHYSGAAVAQMFEEHYGYANVGQMERRRMVDYIRTKSKYLSFDTWRIIFRRALTTSATKVEELPEFGQPLPGDNFPHRVK
jgi:outer membrane protein assembly factor BamB